MKDKKISAINYKEFAEKVLEDVKAAGKNGGVAFLKSAKNAAVFRDEEGNKIYYFWENFDERECSNK